MASSTLNERFGVCEGQRHKYANHRTKDWIGVTNEMQHVLEATGKNQRVKNSRVFHRGLPTRIKSCNILQKSMQVQASPKVRESFSGLKKCSKP